MSIMSIKKDKVTALLDKIAAKYRLVAPVRQGTTVRFQQVTGGAPVVFDYINTVMPPKDLFFPQSETMFTFDTTGGNFEIKEPAKNAATVLFGVRPCDLRSIALLDPVFAEGKFTDTLYVDKRQSTFIIGVACQDADYNCFCNAFGNGPTKSDNADLFFTEQGDKYVVEVLTEKGKQLVQDFKDLFQEDNVDLGFKAEIDKKLVAKMRKVDVSGVKEKLDTMFEHPIWETFYQKCLGCGVCTYVCPTCHCFDIADEGKQDSTGQRLRCWDSCMFGDFTCMAGDHNPRTSQLERVRNRFMHKLKYHTDRYNVEGCVGCGRCIAKCPVNMDITRIISEIKEVN